MKRLPARKNRSSASQPSTKLESSRAFGKQWRDWDLLQRSSFLAQCATAAALVVTVIFSWATWREANQARLDTAALYFAEKAPLIEVTGVVLDGDSVRVMLRNAGESYARYVSASISYPLPPNGSRLVDSGAFDLDMEMSPRSRDIPKQAAYALTLTAPNGTFEALFGMKPISVRMARDDQRASQTGNVLIGGSLLLTINYADSLQTPRRVSEILYLMQNAAPGERTASNIIMLSETTRMVPAEPAAPSKPALASSGPSPPSSPAR